MWVGIICSSLWHFVEYWRVARPFTRKDAARWLSRRWNAFRTCRIRCWYSFERERRKKTNSLSEAVFKHTAKKSSSHKSGDRI